MTSTAGQLFSSISATAVAHSNWVPLSLSAEDDGEPQTLVAKLSPATATSGYHLIAFLARDPTTFYGEFVSLEQISDRIAQVAPAYKRNPPKALVVHIRKLLSSHNEHFSYSLSSRTPRLVIDIVGHITGLKFTWQLRLDKLAPGSSDPSLLNSQLIVPLLASAAALLGHCAKADKALADKDREIEELRAVVAASGGGTGVKVKKSAPFNAKQNLADCLSHTISANETADKISKCLFERQDIEPLYRSIMDRLIPRSADANRDTTELNEPDVALDYHLDGGTQRSGIQGSQLSQAGPKTPEKSKKEEADDMAERRLKELMELGEKKGATAAKPKKRKII